MPTFLSQAAEIDVVGSSGGEALVGSVETALIAPLRSFAVPSDGVGTCPSYQVVASRMRGRK
ncbi:hypothetical protein FJY63_12965 [Candidatus Sumerlaeota bacterium]|nr:hypothetical protein [Candidatus Sumerlaeota bacterium]